MSACAMPARALSARGLSARTYLLSGGAFAVGTSTYVVSGVLPSVSADLHVSLTAAGQLATVFALSYAIGAPLLATLTGTWERRHLLFMALLVAGLGNLLSALAPNFPLLLASRVVSALGAAVFTPAATLFATELMPDRRGRAVARVFGGLTFALVAGVPMGNLLGAHLGYRGVFALIALICLAVAVAARLLLPSMAAPPRVGLRERFAVAADRRVQIMLAITVFGVLGAIGVYTYVVPLLEAVSGVTGSAVGLLLLSYGAGALLGNGLGGRLTDRFGSIRTLLGSMLGFIGSIAVLPWTGTTVIGAGITLFVWATFCWTFNPPVQNLLLDLASGNGLLLSLNASAIYLGAGLSGVVGALVIDTVGVRSLPLVGAGLGVVVLLLMLLLRKLTATQPTVLPASTGDLTAARR